MRYLTLFTALLISGSIFAAEAPNTPPPAPPRGGFGRFGGPGGPGGRMGGFMNRMREQFPNEIAEIEKLQSSDPTAARNKMRELMQKSFGDRFGRMGMMNMNQRNDQQEREVMLPTAEQLETIKAKFPEEFAEYEKLKTEDPVKAEVKIKELMVKTFGEDAYVPEKHLRDRNRKATAVIKMELKKRYPERYAEIEKLQKSNPDKARGELRKLFSESKIKMPAGAAELIYEYQKDGNKNTLNRGNNPMQRNFQGGGNWPRRGGR